MSVKDDVRTQLTHGLEEARRLRDEIKLKLHLGTMEARKRWEEMEPEFRRVEGEVEKGVDEAIGRTTELLEETKKGFQKFLDDLRK